MASYTDDPEYGLSCRELSSLLLKSCKLLVVRSFRKMAFQAESQRLLSLTQIRRQHVYQQKCISILQQFSSIFFIDFEDLRKLQLYCVDKKSFNRFRGSTFELKLPLFCKMSATSNSFQNRSFDIDYEDTELPDFEDSNDFEDLTR